MRTISRLCAAAILLLASCTAPHQRKDSSAKPPGKEPILIVEHERKADTLVEQLGSENYQEREKATSELSSLFAERPCELLDILSTRLKEAKDPETKQRLEIILAPYLKWGITSAVLKRFPDVVEELESEKKRCPCENSKRACRIGTAGCRSTAHAIMEI